MEHRNFGGFAPPGETRSAWLAPGAAADARSEAALDQGLRAHMLGVYNWMASGLLLTAIVAWVVASTFVSAAFWSAPGKPTAMGWVAMLSPLAFVLVLSFGIRRLPLAAAQGLFWLFAAVMGASLSSALMVFTGASVATAFLAAATMFGGMSLWGYTTGRDLSRMGAILFMAMLGLLAAVLLNLFLGSGILSLLVSAAAVVVFTLMTAWDTQRIKNDYLTGDFAGGSAEKATVVDALGLYLNFVAIFQHLLNLTGTLKGEE